MATTPDTGRAGAVLTDPAGDLADRVREAERQLAAGEPLQAFDELAAYVRAEVADRRTMRVLALALARAGATDRAQALLEALLAEAEDPDALGVLARTWRDRWEWERDPERRRASLIRANDLYSQGFRGAQERGDLDAALYTGINAATTLLLLGHAADARDQAAMVRDLCRRRLEAGPDYWAQATLGEAALVAGDLAEAEAHYLAAVRLAGSRYGDLGTTRRQARRLLEALGMDAHVLDAALRVPRVVVFAGHMVDRPGRERPRFPAECEAAVRQAVADRLERLDAGFGFSSAASGADLLFIEAMRERRAEVTVVLPCGRDSFRRESVAIRDDGAWGERFDRILAELPVVYAGEQSETAGPAAYRYANLLQFGLGRLRADRLGTDLVGLAVWDGGPADGPAGTAAQIELWQGRGARTEIVDLALIARAAATGPARAPAGQAGDGAGDRPAGEFEQ
ncbi:MAG: DUF4071 domain-containing protein, partial [Candidatus Sericytochromatia bacterium]|nr:DUF4071 domain-containing protein [Candidatus Tanganyikabacteria bacterium]